MTELYWNQQVKTILQNRRNGNWAGKDGTTLFVAAIFGGIYYFVVNKVTGCDFKCSYVISH